MSAIINPQVALDRELIKRKGFYEFVKRAWHLVEVTPYVDGWHIEEMCAHAEAIVRGRTKKLVVNVPPGTSKSTIFSKLWHPWAWTEQPDLKFMCFSFDHNLALKFAEASFNVLISKWYIERWGNVFDEHDAQWAMGDYKNKSGGFRFSCGLQVKGTGRHANIILGDDPHKPADAAVGATQTVGVRLHSANHRWTDTLASRRADHNRFAQVVVMQRIHALDMSNACIERNYTHLCLPMWYDAERPCKTFDDKGEPIGGDRRTETGELLCPARINEEQAQSLAKEMGPAVASAQLNQRPDTPGGLLYKDETFQEFDPELEAEAFGQGYSVLSIDCTFKDNPGCDYVAFEIWEARFGKFYCYESCIEHLDLNNTVLLGAQIALKWRPNAILVEGKANGPEVVKAFREKLANVIEVLPKTSKYARHQATNVFYAAMSVFHAKSAWKDRKENNLSQFPRAAHDDDTDAGAQALLHLAEEQWTDFESAMKEFKKEQARGAWGKHFSVSKT